MYKINLKELGTKVSKINFPNGEYEVTFLTNKIDIEEDVLPTFMESFVSKAKTEYLKFLGHVTYKGKKVPFDCMVFDPKNFEMQLDFLGQQMSSDGMPLDEVLSKMGGFTAKVYLTDYVKNFEVKQAWSFIKANTVTANEIMQ